MSSPSERRAREAHILQHQALFIRDAAIRHHDAKLLAHKSHERALRAVEGERAGAGDQRGAAGLVPHHHVHDAEQITRVLQQSVRQQSYSTRARKKRDM